MKITHRNIAIISGILIVILVAMWGTNQWVESKIRTMLDRKVQEGQLKYESLSVNIFTNHASIQRPHWMDQKSKHKSKEIKLDLFKVSNFSFAKYLFSKKIEIGKITMINPEATFYPAGIDTLNQDPKSKNITRLKEFLIKEVEVIDGSFQYFKKDTTQLTLSCQLPHLEMEDIRIDSTTVTQSIPFQYGNYIVSARSFFYRMSDLFDLDVKKIDAENDQFSLDSLVIKSPYDKFEFQSHIPHKKTWVNLCIPRTEFYNTDWKLNQDTIIFSSSNVNLSGADLYLYKDNRLSDNPYFKPLYSRMIRDLPVKLDVDSIDIMDAAVTFQLRTTQEPPPGIVYFKDINGTIAHVTNVGMNQPEFPQTVVSADARFMKESSIHLDWSFDIDNPVDAFTVSGNTSRISEQGINYFLTPALNVSAEGAIDQLAFNFAGNNVSATGDMYINYDNLRIDLLKKDGSKRSPWISDIFNFFLKNKLDGAIEKKGLVIERTQTKSFWNYLWEMIKEGALKSIT